MNRELPGKIARSMGIDIVQVRLDHARTALAALETYLRCQRGIGTPFTVADAVAVLVKYRGPVVPNLAWTSAYREGLQSFEQRLQGF